MVVGLFAQGRGLRGARLPGGLQRARRLRGRRVPVRAARTLTWENSNPGNPNEGRADPHPTLPLPHPQP